MRTSWRTAPRGVSCMLLLQRRGAAGRLTWTLVLGHTLVGHALRTTSSMRPSVSPAFAPRHKSATMHASTTHHDMPPAPSRRELLTLAGRRCLDRIFLDSESRPPPDVLTQDSLHGSRTRLSAPPAMSMPYPPPNLSFLAASFLSRVECPRTDAPSPPSVVFRGGRSRSARLRSAPPAVPAAALRFLIQLLQTSPPRGCSA